MNIVYLHGFRSNANSSKVQDLRHMFPEYDVYAPVYDPHDPQKASTQLTNYVNTMLTNEELLVIGTSLGGFWAKWLAFNNFGKALLVNPLMQPYNNLNIGRHRLHDSNEEIVFTQRMKDSFKDFGANHGYFEIALAQDDDIININDTKEYLKSNNLDRPVHEFLDGGHRFNDFKRLKTIIEIMTNTYAG